MIKIDDFLKYRSLSNLRLTLDESKAALTIMQPCLSSNAYRKEIWIYDLSKGIENLTQSLLLEDGTFLDDVQWIDNQTLFYMAEYREETTVCRYIDVNTKTVKAELVIPEKVSGIWQVSEDKYIYSKNINISEEAYPKELGFLKEHDAEFETIDEIPIYDNGKGFVSQKRKALYQWSKASQAKKLTPKTMNVDKVIQKPEGLFFMARTYHGQTTEPGIYLVENETYEVISCVPESIYRIRQFDTSIDAKTGKVLVYFVAQDKRTCLMSSDLSFYKAVDGQVERMDIPETSVGDSVSSDCVYGALSQFEVKDGKLLYVETKEWGSLIKCHQDGDNTKVLTPEKDAVNGFVSLKDGSILCIALKGLKQQELYYVKDGELTQLSNFNEGIHSEKDLSKPETFSFKNHGFNVNYVVLPPTDFDPEKTYPAILYIHGGAKILYSGVFFHEMQYLASCGYYVIYGNPHGSDGQGSEFAKLQGEYGQKDYDDLMKAMDKALELYPNIDKNRLGVAGGSYGGIMTNWTITHTNRFRAAVAQRSICNMVSTFGTADNGFNFVKEQMDGDIWNGIDKLWSQSPLKYADKCQTPLLLIHSDEDYRCHYTEALQMFTAMKYLGVESKVILIHGENHDLSRAGRPIQRIKRLYEIKKWFDEHLEEVRD